MPKQTKQKKRPQEKVPLNKPWIPMRTGLIIITITSIAMAVLTAYQAIPVKGTLEGILYGLLFGGLIWIIFLGMILFNRWIRRG
jgi:hypothetical protein